MNIDKYNRLSLINCIVICLIGIWLFPTGCVEPFDPKVMQDTTGILVVDGTILDKGTTIKLSRTVIIDDTTRHVHFSPTEVNNAIVQVIDDYNRVIAIAKPQVINGTATPEYVVDGEIIFNPGTQYALDIQIGGKHYQSDFVTPVLTPEIDELTWRDNDGTSIDIMVSTHDPNNEVQYYRWLFEEDWEIRAQIFSEVNYDPLTYSFVDQSLSGPNNLYYCWASDKSKTIALGTTFGLTEATIKNKLIHNFTSNNSRYSYLYSILVKQHGLNKEAYMYYENVKKNIEQGSGIFAPQPSELQGNIQCISHPDEPVIGYIYAAREVVVRKYIDMADMKQIYDNKCNDFDKDFEFRHKSAIVYYYHTPHAFLPPPIPMGIIFCDSYDICLCAPRICTDCTQQGGTKNKPYFWPNDHQ